MKIHIEHPDRNIKLTVDIEDTKRDKGFLKAMKRLASSLRDEISELEKYYEEHGWEAEGPGSVKIKIFK